MSFDMGEGWPAMRKELKKKGVEVVTMDGPEVGRVRAMSDGEPEKGRENQAKMIFHGNFHGPVFFGNGA